MRNQLAAFNSKERFINMEKRRICSVYCVRVSANINPYTHGVHKCIFSETIHNKHKTGVTLSGTPVFPFKTLFASKPNGKREATTEPESKMMEQAK